jgi:hypothetical protein
MSEQFPRPEPDVAQAQTELRAVADHLRGANHLSPADQQKLADLLVELSGALGPPSAEMIHVAQSATQLAQHLHQEEKGPPAAALEQLQRALARVGANAPVTVIARRLIDALADIGI